MRRFVLECGVCGARWPRPPEATEPRTPAHDRAGESCPGSGGPAKDVELRTRHYIGLDLAQTTDYTAVGIIERLDTYDVVRRFFAPGDPTDANYRGSLYLVRWLDRLRHGISYPDVARHVAGLLRDPRLTDPILTMDRTGIGRPVLDTFHEFGVHPTALTITAGNSVTATGGGVGVPKRDLVTATRILLDTGRLRIAPALRYAEALRAELKGYQVQLSETGRDSYGAAGGLHDDLVIALSLAAWQAARDVEHYLRRPVRKVPPDFSIFRL